MAERLYVLPGGWMDMAGKWLVQGGGEDEVSVPMPYFLVESGERRLLIDAGCHPDVAADPAAVWGRRVARHYRPRISEEDLLLNRLAQLELGADDVTDIILTHMHMDHAGAVQFFGSATIWVQASEYRWAMNPDGFARSGYIESDINHPHLNYRLLEGDAEIGDGIRVVNTPGHTPGHQSVLVQLPEAGWVCVVGDALYTRELLEKRRMPGVVWHPEDTMMSASRLKTLEDGFGVRLIFNHDAAGYEELEKAPDFIG